MIFILTPCDVKNIHVRIRKKINHWSNYFKFGQLKSIDCSISVEKYDGYSFINPTKSNILTYGSQTRCENSDSTTKIKIENYDLLGEPASDPNQIDERTRDCFSH